MSQFDNATREKLRQLTSKIADARANQGGPAVANWPNYPTDSETENEINITFTPLGEMTYGSKEKGGKVQALVITSDYVWHSPDGPRKWRGDPITIPYDPAPILAFNERMSVGLDIDNGRFIQLAIALLGWSEAQVKTDMLVTLDAMMAQIDKIKAASQVLTGRIYTSFRSRPRPVDPANPGAKLAPYINGADFVRLILNKV